MAMIDHRLPQPIRLRIRNRSAQKGVLARADRRRNIGARSVAGCRRCFPFAQLDYGTMYKAHLCGSQHKECKFACLVFRHLDLPAVTRVTVRNLRN
jgi:hypothetical protein